MRAIAGIYDPSGATDRESAGSLLRRALGADAPLEVAFDGPLAVAWSNRAPRPDPGGPLLCVLDGDLYDLDVLAEEAGAPAGCAPEAVLGAAYRRWGSDMLRRLRGDFVVVVWDRDRAEGLIAVDQVNGRSLCLHDRGARLLFASETVNLLRMLPRRPGPDDAAVAHWLADSRIPPERTLYAGVRRLEAAHCVRVAEGRWSAPRRYWAPVHAPMPSGPRDELVARVREAIVRAVRRRCTDSSATAITLSGGLDSSSIAAVAMRCLRPAGLTGAYSAVFPELPEIDEGPLIDRLVDAYDLPSTRIEVRSGSVVGGSLEYLRMWELPPISPNLFFWVPLARRALADGFSVLLDGEDGDRLFGFTVTLLADHLRAGQIRSAADLVRRMPNMEGPITHELIRRVLWAHGVKGALPHAVNRLSRLLRYSDRRDPDAPSWLSGRAARDQFDTYDPTAWKRLRGPRWRSFLIQGLLTGMSPRTLFDHTRRRTALAGLESRHPFADVDLIELMLRLPHELAFDRRFTRPVLREAMAGLVPDPVRLRPSKSFFDILFHRSLRDLDLPLVRSLVDDPHAEIRAYVRPEVVRADLLDRPPPGARRLMAEWAAEAWRLVTVECWLRSQADPSFPDRLMASGRLAEPSYAVRAVPAGAR